MQNNEMEIQTAVGSHSSPPWIELPEDVTANILRRLGAIQILGSAEKVCTTWRRVCRDPSMWRVIDLASPCLIITGANQRSMCRLARSAVDRSRGELVDIRIDYFGDEELLNYIVDRSNHLRRLTVDRCYSISEEALVQAVKKLPQLEELHILFIPMHAANIAAICVTCPELKAFTFDIDPSTLLEDNGILDGNEYALAIATTMPNLVRLSLWGNWMKNEGLEAILNGCRRLEFLNIEECYNLDLKGDLGKRCSEQIKYLKRDPDRESDHEDVDELMDYEDVDESIGSEDSDDRYYMPPTLLIYNRR